VGKCIYLCGDFNAVRNLEERRSRGVAVRSLDYHPFNDLIDNDVLVDLPLHGRNFTWYKGDGNSMSRLDRFLLSLLNGQIVCKLRCYVVCLTIVL